jgi:uncharacterized protein YjbJ (UPF0337 family)
MVDKDRVEGAAKKATGAIKKTAGKVLGDRKMEGEGRAKEAEGDVQNTIGGAKDKVREILHEK